jgi:Na+/proline symporter
MCFYGIPALIYSIKARLQLAIGKTEEAKLSAKKARKFNIIGIFSGIICIFICLILFLLILICVFLTVNKIPTQKLNNNFHTITASVSNNSKCT